MKNSLNKINPHITFNKKGQAVLEYVGLMGLVVLALFAFSMQDYLKRSIGGRLRDDVGGTFGSEQYYGQKTDIYFLQYINETWSVTGNNR